MGCGRVQVSEEIKFDPKVMVDRVDRRQTFHQAQLEHGDILVVQPLLPQVPPPSPPSSPPVTL